MEFNYEYARVNEVNNGVVWRGEEREEKVGKSGFRKKITDYGNHFVNSFHFFSTILSLLLAL